VGNQLQEWFEAHWAEAVDVTDIFSKRFHAMSDSIRRSMFTQKLFRSFSAGTN